MVDMDAVKTVAKELILSEFGELGIVDANAIKAVIKEMILPEFGELRKQVAEINSRLELTNKRLDDINIHLADQSRRIDAVREEHEKFALKLNNLEQRLAVVEKRLAA